MTHYHTCMSHIDHMRRLNIDPGLVAYLSNILFDLYTHTHTHTHTHTEIADRDPCISSM